MRREDKAKARSVLRAIGQYFMAIAFLSAFIMVTLIFMITPFNAIYARRLHEDFVEPMFKKGR